jgi:hypothetical protein
MFLLDAWSFTQVLDGMSRVPPLLPSKAGFASKLKGQRELNDLSVQLIMRGSTMVKAQGNSVVGSCFFGFPWYHLSGKNMYSSNH